MVIGGVQYVTTSQAVELLAGSGVTAALLRQWISDPRTPLDVVRDPAGRPVRLPAPGGQGKENVLAWRDVVDVEWATRTSRRGRRRALAAAA